MKSFNQWIRIREAQEVKPKAKINVPKIAIIMRGVPGSGKSHTAREMLVKHGGNPDGHIFSSDNQFIPETRKSRRQGNYVSGQGESEEYKKNYGKLLSQHAAHIRNLHEFKAAVDQGTSPLIVDNTNVKAERARPYADYADKAGYEIKIQEPTSSWWKDYRDYLGDKKEHADKLKDFVKILHSHQTHGVPKEIIQKMIDEWQPKISVEDVLGRETTPKSKFEWVDAAHVPYEFASSKISGHGLIVRQGISKGAILGPTHRLCMDGCWEMMKPLGNYNHSSDFNAIIIKKPTCKEIKVIKDLSPGDEIVVDYREQPDLEQPNFDWIS